MDAKTKKNLLMIALAMRKANEADAKREAEERREREDGSANGGVDK